jgi:hypothetical protein
MEEFFSKFTQKGLPGGPNELKAFTEGFITSSEGQWAYPGMNTLIPNAGGRITMQGVNYPVLGIDDLGNEMMMQPGEEYQFPGDSVYEIPMKKGGLVKMPKLTKKNKKSYNKKFSSSIDATSRLFTESKLFAKSKSKKKKVFDPNAKYQDGGVVQLDGYRFKKDANGNWIYESGAPVTDRGMIQRLTYEAKPVGSPVVQNAPKFGTETVLEQNKKKYQSLINSPKLEDQETAENLINNYVDQRREKEIYYPEVTPDLIIQPKTMNDLRGMEFKVNQALGFPMEKARLASEAAAGPREDPVDNFRHSNAGRYTAEAIANYTGNIPYVSSALGFLGANALGLGHEAMTLLKGNDKRDLSDRLLESGEDMYNNFIGAKVGASDMTPEEKTNYLRYLSSTNQLADGVVIPKNSKSKSVDNMYFKKGPNDPGKYKSSYDDGGEYEEAELTEEEIEEYRRGGWIVEEIDTYKKGGAASPLDLNPETMKKYREILKVQENSLKSGYRKAEDKWYPHKSPEGGEDTVGFGHKLIGPDAYKYTKGLTTKEAENLLDSDILKHQTVAKNLIDTKYGKGTFDSLPQDSQMLLVDYAYNGVLNSFPTFTDALVKGDKTTMLKEYKRYSGSKLLGERNEWTRSVIEGLNAGTAKTNTPKTLPAKTAPKQQPVKQPVKKPIAQPKFSSNETFSYDYRPDAVYRVADSGDWYINAGKDTHNEFIKLNDPTGKRTETLRKFAHINEVPLDEILNRINNSGNYDSRTDLGYVPGQ